MDKKYRIQITELGADGKEDREVFNREVKNITMLADTSDTKQVELIINNTLMGVAQQIVNSKKLMKAIPIVNMFNGLLKDDDEEDNDDDEVSPVDNGDQ